MGEVESVLENRNSSVTSVAFSQDGSQIVSGSDDHTVRIWNTMTGEVKAELKGHMGCVMYCVLPGWQPSCLWIR
jgi:WD40 repeat protein